MRRVAMIAAAVIWGTHAYANPTSAPERSSGNSARIALNYSKMPLTFEVNNGQTDEQVKYLARGVGYTLFLTSQDAVLSLRNVSTTDHESTGAAIVRMRLRHGNSRSQISGLDTVQQTSNYLLGNDPGKWHRNVAHYARVQYSDVYPGIDLVYYGSQRQLEYDFVVAPHADPTLISIEFEGCNKLSIDQQGNLLVATSGGNLIQHRPVIYQEMDGHRTEVSGNYVLQGENGVGFQIASYDAQRPLVIDPVLSYATFLGGSNSEGYYQAIAVDGDGNAYVAGYTRSADFPTAVGSVQASFGGGVDYAGNPNPDAFITKLNADGTAAIYSTFLGGNGDDRAKSIAVDGSGNAYVVGSSFSSTFPTTPGAFQTTFAGDSNLSTGDGFLAKLNPSGSDLIYSTFLGGSKGDSITNLAIDSSRSAYVFGNTSSTNFPITPGAYQTAFSHVFIAKFDATGTGLVYSTYLPSGGYAMAVDTAGAAYVAGRTESASFPVTPGAYQTVYGENSDATVIKLNATGSALVYATYLGGSDFDQSSAITVDGDGNAYITGETYSDFPVTAGAFQTLPSDAIDLDLFITKLNASGTALVYSTYLGGFGPEYSTDIAVDSAGDAYVTGYIWNYASLQSFPITPDAYQSVLAGDSEPLLSKLSADGSTLVYSTYLGGSAQDLAFGIALDCHGAAYVVGQTESSDFPVTPGAYQTAYGGGVEDTFIAKLAGLTTPSECSCGDGTCGDGETCSSCSEDCGACSCGNASCDPSETCANCPTDCECVPPCGDGHIDLGEQCDDGNTTSGDGCDGNCQLEPFSLTLSPTTDEETVGKGHIVTAEFIGGSPLAPIAAALIRFAVTSGPNAGVSGICSPLTCTTDDSGTVDWVYVSNGDTGTDTIEAFYDANNNSSREEDEPMATAEMEWLPPPLLFTGVFGGTAAEVFDDPNREITTYSDDDIAQYVANIAPACSAAQCVPTNDSDLLAVGRSSAGGITSLAFFVTSVRSHATLNSPGNTATLTADISSNYETGSPVFLAGHSGGGGDVQDVLEKLARLGIPVEASAHIDSIEIGVFNGDSSIPANTKVAMGYFQKQTALKLFIRGENKLKPVDRKKTIVTNTEILGASGPADPNIDPYAYHRNMDNDPRTWTPLLSKIRTAASLAEHRAVDQCSTCAVRDDELLIALSTVGNPIEKREVRVALAQRLSKRKDVTFVLDALANRRSDRDQLLDLLIHTNPAGSESRLEGEAAATSDLELAVAIVYSLKLANSAEARQSMIRILEHNALSVQDARQLANAVYLAFSQSVYLSRDGTWMKAWAKHVDLTHTQSEVLRTVASRFPNNPKMRAVRRLLSASGG